MMNVVIFLNAAHQRKYVDVLNRAMAGSTEVRVQALDFSKGEKTLSAAKQSLAVKLMSLKPLRLTTKFLGAVFYIPYAGFMKLREQYFGHIHKNLRLAVVCWTRQMQRRTMYTELRNLFRPGARFLFGLLFGVLNYFRRRSVFYALLSEYRQQCHLKDKLFSLQPDLIVLLEDNAEGSTGLVSHTARMHKIPYVVLPDYIPNPAEPARYYYNAPLHSAASLTGKLIRLFAPRWILEYDGKHLLRLPSRTILVKSVRGQHCPQPWILNAGYTEAILLESKASLKHYEHLGFKPGKLSVIGGAVEDELHAVQLDKEQRRKALDTKYQLDPAKPLVVCGFPPDQYTAATEGFEFKTYDELCRNWFAALAKASDLANVLVVRHPRMMAGVLHPYATGGVQIASETLETILPVADIYVACISTTIRWALALAMPVINYDTYRYDYGDFSDAKACSEVTSVVAFRAELEQMLQPGELERLNAVAYEDADQWGLMDGRFKTRLRDSLLEIRKNYKGAASSTHKKDYRLQKLA